MVVVQTCADQSSRTGPILECRSVCAWHRRVVDREMGANEKVPAVGSGWNDVFMMVERAIRAM
jgi:hypothetical protein